MTEPAEIRRGRPRMPVSPLDQAPWWLLPRRVGIGLLAAGRFFVTVSWDALRGRRGPSWRAVRARESLEWLGGTAVRMGIELSQRLDALPYETAVELSAMRDRQPPFGWEIARPKVEAAAGRPVAEVFASVEPRAVYSDSLVCVFRARLLDGAPVAVRVRRPGAAREVAADLLFIRCLIRLAELLALVRPGRWSRLSEELRELLVQQIDFVSAARYQRLTRRFVRKAKLGFVEVAHVYAELGSDEIMVSAFVDGLSCEALLELRAPERAAAMAAAELDGARLGRRLLHLAWWSLFEAPVFQGSPHPRRIVFLPRDRIAFVGLADCGAAARRTRRVMKQTLKKLAEDDVADAAAAVLQALAPLPAMDTGVFLKQLEGCLWPRLFALQDPHAPWFDRTSSPTWLAVLDAARAEGAPVRDEVLRMIRAALLYDAIVGEIWPEVDTLATFRTYLRKADARTADAFSKESQKMMERGLREPMLARAAETRNTIDRLTFWLEATLDDLPVAFLTMTGKAAYATAVVIQAVLLTAGLVVVVSLGVGVSRWAAGDPVTARAVAAWLTGHPWWVAGPALLVIAVTIRRILFRLGDKDHAR